MKVIARVFSVFLVAFDKNYLTIGNAAKSCLILYIDLMSGPEGHSFVFLRHQDLEKTK